MRSNIDSVRSDVFSFRIPADPRDCASPEGSSAVSWNLPHAFANTALGLGACLKVGVSAIVTTAQPTVMAVHPPRGSCTLVHVATHDEGTNFKLQGSAQSFTVRPCSRRPSQRSGFGTSRLVWGLRRSRMGRTGRVCLSSLSLYASDSAWTLSTVIRPRATLPRTSLRTASFPRSF